MVDVLTPKVSAREVAEYPSFNFLSDHCGDLIIELLHFIPFLKTYLYSKESTRLIQEINQKSPRNQQD
jgi:hypothetical protein